MRASMKYNENELHQDRMKRVEAAWRKETDYFEELTQDIVVESWKKGSVMLIIDSNEF